MSIDKSRLRTAGIYIIIFLAIVRLLIMPLQRSLDAKKSLLSEKLELYSTRQALSERQAGDDLKQLKESDVREIAGALYPKDTPLTWIQAEVLKDLIGNIEKNGLTVTGFEMPDAAAGKNISEANVILRMQGQPSAMVELLRGIQKTGRLLSIKIFETTPGGNMQSFTLTISAFRAEKP